MSNGVFAAAIVAIVTGVSVYRSCIHHQRILQRALLIDAVMVSVLISIFWFAGVLP